jgi:RecB family exonuclease
MPVELYVDPDTGMNIVTHSMVKAFRRCPRQAMYKYVDRLKPKALSKPLKRGTWIHALLETHYKGGDWRDTHKKLSEQFYRLFVEEQEALGDLPREIRRLMQSYFWHYRDDADWKVLETEFTIETELFPGTIYRGRVDNLVETPYGLYVVDHKSHRTLPDLSDQLLDPQSVLYVWAARRLGMPVKGFIWNYIKTDPPKQLRFKKDGNLYAKQGATDYPTAYRSLMARGIDPRDEENEKWVAYLKPLQNQRYRPDSTLQLSPFFRRDTLEKDDAMIERAVKEVIHTVKRMQKYPFDKRDYVERVVNRDCKYFCSYRSICTSDLMGGNSELIARQQFRVGDPMDYYRDDKLEETTS